VCVVAPCKRVLAAVRETATAMVEQAQRTRRAAYSILVSRVHAGSDAEPVDMPYLMLDVVLEESE
jgi:hypothetical protein